MERERCKFASTCAMTITDDAMRHVYDNIEFFRNKVLLRPSEISNNPEVIRRLGVIAMNTALEADIFGNVNSTHVLGTKMMNGIGGSGDFARNAYISIFSCPSVAKGGLISAIVPMVAHVDHSEHSVDVIITEQGVADLRGKDPVQRAEAIIETAHIPTTVRCSANTYASVWDRLPIPFARLSQCTRHSTHRATCTSPISENTSDKQICA